MHAIIFRRGTVTVDETRGSTGTFDRALSKGFARIRTGT